MKTKTRLLREEWQTLVNAYNSLSEFNERVAVLDEMKQWKKDHPSYDTMKHQPLTK